jgi:hypothetical protein
MPINIPASSASGLGNTGQVPKKFDLKRITSLLLVPKGFEFTAAECLTPASFKAALKTHSQKDDRNVRIFPIHGITNFEAADTEPTEYTAGYGQKRTISNGKYGMKLTFLDDLTRHANLMEFNNEDYDFILVDEACKFQGKRGAVAGGLAGATGKMTVTPYKLPTASEPALYKVDLNLDDPSELNQLSKIGYMDCDNQFDFENEIPGVNSLVLTEGAATANIKIYVKVCTADGNVNLYDTYATQLESAALWSIKLTSDYTTPVVIATVAKDAATKSFLITTAAQATVAEMAVYLDGPATLAAASIGGAPSVAYEAPSPLIVTMPAP